MPDQTDGTTTAPSPVSDVSAELASSLASVWARFAGARPTDCELEFDGKVVRWRHPEGLEALNQGIDASEEEDGAERTMSGYLRATSSAVTKVTHRRVSARMSKLDKETGAATETFILEAITRKY